MITLKNLIPNSNFDILDEIGGRIVCKNWSNLYTSGFNYTAAAVNTDTEHRNIETTAIHNTCLDSKYSYNGNYSILINTKMFEPIISDVFELKKDMNIILDTINLTRKPMILILKIVLYM